METDTKLTKVFQQIFWDYNYEISELNDILTGKNPGNSWLNKNYILRRMFERLSWYELLEILGKDEINSILTDPFIASLRDVGLRKKYGIIRQLLQGKTLSLSGWDNAHRERLQNSLFSHRWDRPE